MVNMRTNLALLAALGAMGLTACQSDGRYRVASVGGTGGSGFGATDADAGDEVGSGGDRSGEDGSGDIGSGDGQSGQDGSGQAGTGGDDTGQDGNRQARTGGDQSGQDDNQQAGTGDDQSGQDGNQQADTGGDQGGQDGNQQAGTGGDQSETGSQSELVQLFGLGEGGIIAAGGLVGGSGVANTGLLANTGDPESNVALASGAQVEIGEMLSKVSGTSTQFATMVDAAVPGSTTLAGTVVSVIDNAGMALVDTGNGDQYLVDGLLAAPGELVDVSIGQATAIGSADVQPLIDASILSSNSASASLLGADVLSADSVLALNAGSEGAVLTPVTETVNTVTGTLSGGSGKPGIGDVKGLLNNAEGKKQGLLNGVADKKQGLLDGVVDTKQVLLESVGDTKQGLLETVGDTKQGILDHVSSDGSDKSDPVTGLVGGLFGKKGS